MSVNEVIQKIDLFAKYISALQQKITLEKYGLEKYCTVEPELLWRAVLDYFEDIA